MGVLYTRAVGALSSALVLSPERYDPRRSAPEAVGARLGDLVDIVTETVGPAGVPDDEAVLILDTTHAYEGFVLFKHAPVAREAIGSLKRPLRPGDVLISRLRPYLRQVALVDDALFALGGSPNRVVASTELYVLRGRDGFDAAALVPFLLTGPVQAALAAAQEGGHHPRFNRGALTSLVVPEWLLRENARLAAEVRANVASMRRALSAATTMARTVEQACAPGSRHATVRRTET